MNPVERNVVLGLLAAGSLVGDFLLPFVIRETGPDSVVITSLLVGCFGAQLCLISAWCALANQALLVRVPITVGIFVVGLCLFLAGLRIAADGFGGGMDEVVVVAVLGCTMLLGAQIPLWIIRVVARRRIGVATESIVEPSDSKFSIRYMTAATAGVAVIVALVQSVMPDGEFGGTAGMWGAMLFTIGLLALFSASVTIPGLWLVLSDSDSGRTSAAIGLLLAWGGGPLVLIVALAVFFGSPPPDGRVLGVIYAFGTGACGAMIGGLLAMRALGYRLLMQLPDGTLRVVSDRPESIASTPPADANDARR